MNTSATDLDLPCPHEHFAASVDVGRITASDDDPTVIAYETSISIECAHCAEKFRWTGLQAGVARDRPMCSPDEFELRAPIRPASADPDFGLGIPGFAVTWTEGP